MLGPHTYRDNPLSRILCDPIVPPVTVCHTVKTRLLFCFFLEKNIFVTQKFTIFARGKMVKRNDKKNTGGGGKGKKGSTVSDEAGGKSLSDTCTSAGVKSTVIRTSVNIFEASKRDKTQYFFDKVKDKRRTKNNNIEFLIG